MAANKNASTMRRLGRRLFANAISRPVDDGSWQSKHRAKGWDWECSVWIAQTGSTYADIPARGPYCLLSKADQ